MIGRTVFSISLLAGIFFSNFKLEVSGIGLLSNLSALFLVLGGILSTALVPYTWGRTRPRLRTCTALEVLASNSVATFI